jgi:hypothetical protein
LIIIIIIIINTPSDPDRARKRPQSKRSQSPETAINPSATPSAPSAAASAAAAAKRRPDAPGFLGNPVVAVAAGGVEERPLIARRPRPRCARPICRYSHFKSPSPFSLPQATSSRPRFKSVPGSTMTATLDATVHQHP